MYIKIENPDAIGYTVIEVLDFLKGRELDKVSLGYIYALRPSSVRISDSGGIHMDSMPWRVTIYRKDNKITKIQQEIKVALYDDVQCGQHLDCLLKGIEYK